MKTYLKTGAGFIALNHHEDGAEVRLNHKQAKYLLLSGVVREKAAPQEVNQEVKAPRKKGSANADGGG